MTTTANVTRLVATGAAMAAGVAGAASAQDFGGTYAGVTLGTASGSFQDGGNYNLQGSALGGFVGYNFVSGNLVYGAEIEYNGPVETDALFNLGISSIIDLKGRIGTTVGNTLFYGTLGVSSVDFEGGKSTASTTGTLIGAGVETGFAGNAFVGLEVLSRNFNQSSDAPLGVGPQDMLTTGIRIGMRF